MFVSPPLPLFVTPRTTGDYPYNGSTGQCHADPKKPTCGTCSGYTDVATNEAALQAAATGRVVSIAIAAEQDFMFYSTGVFDSTTCPTSPDSLNHGQPPAIQSLSTPQLTAPRCRCRRLRLHRRLLDCSQFVGANVGRERLYPHEDGQELVRAVRRRLLPHCLSARRERQAFRLIGAVQCQTHVAFVCL